MGEKLGWELGAGGDGCRGPREGGRSWGGGGGIVCVCMGGGGGLWGAIIRTPFSLN